MKNEFYDELLVIGKAKKRYIYKQRLREGNQLTPPKADIKGFDFKKATTSEYTESVFMKIIKDHILNSDTIELKDMIRELQEFKKEIHSSIKRGERTFLPNGNAKAMQAYKDPGSEQTVRGVLTWNMLNPDNRIEIPSRVSLVKMNIFKEEDIEELRYTHPEIYKTIIKEIFHDETGIFVVKSWNPKIDYVNPKNKKWIESIPKKFRTKYKKLGPQEWNKFVDEVLDYESNPEKPKPKGIKDDDIKGYYEYKKRGLQVLAIPSNGKIPDWALEYVDYTTMVNNIMAPIKPVLEIFHCEFPEVGKNRNSVNRKTNTLTNMVKF